MAIILGNKYALVTSELLQECGSAIKKLVRLAYSEAPEEYIHQIKVHNVSYGAADSELQLIYIKEGIIYTLKYEEANKF